MKWQLFSVNDRPPPWASDAYTDYAKRLPREYAWHLREFPPNKRHRDANTRKREEGERLLAACPSGAWTVLLDERGTLWTTAQLAERQAAWATQPHAVVWLIGGPDGVSEAVKSVANECWSLSPLTLPHALVRVLVAEQLYRAWSVRHHHPYHRA